MKKFFFLFAISLFSLYAQDDLESILDKEAPEPKKEFVVATFKSPRLVTGHTIEMPAKNELIFIISHRFGSLNSGAYNLFGLDQSTIRLGLEYSPLDFLCVGVGRSSYNKTFDGFLKVKLLRQSLGKKAFPFSLVYLSSMALNSLKWKDPTRENYFSSRLAFTHQLLLARKFGKRFSLQLMPTMVHKNLVTYRSESNDIFAIGAGGRIKITHRITLTTEYYYLIPYNLPLVNGYSPINPLSFGINIETGGHVFQLTFSNSLPMFNEAFITETLGNWLNGGIHFGFNITRTFSLD